MTPLWLYIDFPCLQLDTLFYQGHENKVPIVVADTKSYQVLQLNDYAGQAGIAEGMTLGSAAALSQNLQVIPYQENIEIEKLQEVAEHLYQVTSDICLQPPQGLLLRIHNMLNLHGGISPYWQQLQTQLASFQLSYHYSTGFSPLAAQLLAETRWDQVTAHHDEVYRALKKVMLRHTHLPEKNIKKLNKVGIHSIGKLLNVPLPAIAKRFGKELTQYLSKLTSTQHHAVDFYQPKSVFHRYIELLYEISSIQVLLHPLKQLFIALEQFLKIRDWVTLSVSITLYHREAESRIIHVASHQGEYQSKKWLSLVELKFENITLSHPIYAVDLSTQNTYPYQPNSDNFFSKQRSAMTPLQLISILHAKLSGDCIHHLTLNNDHRPEISSSYSRHSHTYVPHSLSQPVRPSFLLSPPHVLNEHVSLLYGPERLYTGWWDNYHLTRDYFVARSQQGQFYWVYKDVENKWFVHGLFS